MSGYEFLIFESW